MSPNFSLSHLKCFTLINPSTAPNWREMPQFPSLKLLFSSSTPLASLSLSFRPLFNFPVRSLRRPNSSLTVLSYSGRKSRRPTGTGGGRFLSQRRGNSTLREEKVVGGSGTPDMEAKEAAAAAGFNRKRAEGRDKPNKPKNLERKVRKVNPVNTICYVQILGTGMDTQDTLPSVLLFFDKQRFIFNAGEGLQRFCTEHKIKLSKIDHMFLTRVCSETAGGLPGLLLTLAGIGEEGMAVNIWGPSDIKYLVDAMRSFIPNAAMVHTHSFGLMQGSEGAEISRSKPNGITEPIVLIDDEVVRLSAIPLKPSYSGVFGSPLCDSNTSNLMSSSREECTNQIPVTSDSCLQDKTKSMVKPGDIAVIYACELPEIRGTFNPRKAADLGLKPGPKYRELQLGNSVMSDNFDKMIHPSDVLGESSPGPIVLLVDCPTPFHMTELFSMQSLNCYYEDSVDQPSEGSKVVNCVIHLGPSFVTKSADYQKWMNRFGSTQHIMAGHEMRNMEIPILKSSARISSRLNYLCPQLFPAPGFCSAPQINNFSLASNDVCEEPSPSLCEAVSAENLLKFHLRPKAQLGLDRSLIPSMSNHQDIVNELLSEIPEVVDASKSLIGIWLSSLQGRFIPTKHENVVMVEEPWIDGISCISSGNMGRLEADACKEDIPFKNGIWKNEVKRETDIPGCLENITREDMEIVLLGTGSSQPSKYRNVSSVFINLFSKGSLLLDCGEGTLGQLKRRYGVNGADDAVKGLRCIWISHIHADHHTGLARILALRSQLLKGVPHEPIPVVGPRQLKRFLDAYSRVEDLDMQFLDCSYTTEASLGGLLSSQASSKDRHLEHVEKDSRDVGREAITSSHLESTLFAQSTRMESFWKRPRSLVDSSTALPILVRLKELLSESGLEALYSIPVIHCPHAFGVVLKASERINSAGKAIPGWKLVYSGDTRPCQALIDASHDATVLIHEATFEDGMEDEAIARNHSTTMEAINVGESAGAYRIILTHFSQRYPKIPVFDEAHMHRTCIGFDLMSVNLADLPVLPKVLPYLRVLFKNEMVIDESDEILEAAVN